jgi:peroxiredoxin
MKKWLTGIFAISALVYFSACKNGTTGGKNFNLNGTVTGMQDGKLYLVHQDSAMQNIFDTLEVKGGKFSFSGNVNEPTPYYIINDPQAPAAPLIFFAEKGDVKIEADASNLQFAKVTGAKNQEMYNQYRNSVAPLAAKADSIMKLSMNVTDQGQTVQLQEAYMRLNEEESELIRKFVKEHPEAHVSAFLIVNKFLSQPAAEEIEPLYNGLSPEVKNSTWGKQIADVYNKVKSTSIGSKAPDFTLEDVNGKPMSLSSLRGQYVLVDFWASWCGPCRAENPNVVKAYNQFKGKNFTILGVSLDKEKDKWLAAIDKDKLAWPQVSDLKGWESSAAALYFVQSIPANFLLDKEGKIVARNLRGDELSKKLAELMP